MIRKEFESEMGKVKRMFTADVQHNCFWWGYADGLRQGFYGMNFRGEETHVLWWAAAEEADPSRRERGMGYRAGYRCAKFGTAYCAQKYFRCETCSLVKDGLDCHKSPMDME